MPHRCHLRALLPLLCVLSLMGCGKVIPLFVEVRTPQIPADLRSCDPPPPVPDQGFRTDAEVAEWFLADRKAGADCRSRLQRVDAILTAFDAEAAASSTKDKKP